MPDSRQLQVSSAELDVLKVLWRKRSSTLGEVHEQLSDRHAYTTVQTMLDRLVQKGLVGRDRSSRPARHRARVTRTRVMRHFFGLMLENVCDGPAPMVLQLLRDESFSAEELEEIQREIDRSIRSEKGDRDASA
jgi:predicted transcriptional regulator